MKTAKKIFFQAGYYWKIFKYFFTSIDLQPLPVDKVYASFKKLTKVVNIYPIDQGYSRKKQKTLSSKSWADDTTRWYED